MISSIITVIFSFVLAVIAVALVLKISYKQSWFDRIDDRKVHNGNVPRLGGLGFAAVYIIITVLITLFHPDFSPGLRFLLPIAALVIILGSGVVDDFRPLKPTIKISFHSMGAICVIVSGFTLSSPFFIESVPLVFLEWAAVLFTFIWIVGMTNAINLIDGVDGLAGGLSVIIALTYAAAFFLLEGAGPGLIYSLCLAAVLLGFLVFNAPLPKARIFMGDGGAYSLGFILAILPLIVRQETTSTLPMFYAGALVLIPVYDTVAAIWRRLRDGRRIDSPDKAHTHHKLINLGLSDRQIDGTFYSLQCLLGILVLISIKVKGVLSLILLAAAYLSALAFFAAVHFLYRRKNKALYQKEPVKSADKTGKIEIA